MNIAFTTERLYIRFAQIADAAELLKLVNQDNFTKYIGDKGIYTLDAVSYTHLRAHET